jgi:hypothetical protein
MLQLLQGAQVPLDIRIRGIANGENRPIIDGYIGELGY